MNLLEYQAKHLLSEYAIATPDGQLVDKTTKHSLNYPVILKSQVPVGGRGKLGGIKRISSDSELRTAITTLSNHKIKGHTPTALLAEQALSIQKEYYLAFLVDRTSQTIQLVAHKEGGMDVESQQDFQKWTIPYAALDADTLGQSLAEHYDLPGQTFALQDLIEKLYRCFTENDATLLEINPLILTKENQLVAGDCKMTLDDAAAFRHDWPLQTEVNFVTINEKGDTATIANGAGLAMATVDAAYDAGLQPANFLDIGGGASVETLLNAFKRILEYPKVKVIIINIFAGITRSDEVARAIIIAKQQLPILPKLYIRLAGTNQREAHALLNTSHIATEITLEACLQKAKEYIG